MFNYKSKESYDAFPSHSHLITTIKEFVVVHMRVLLLIKLGLLRN
jgi:hypothetical protein